MKIKLSDVQVQQTGRTVGQFIRPGVNELRINDIILKPSKDQSSLSPIFLCETRPITSEGWTGLDGASGQIGKISANQGYYIKNEEQLMRFVGFVKEVAGALGVLDQISDIEFEDLTELVDKISPIFTDPTLFARYFVCGEEYAKQGGGKGLKLFFGNRRSVESVTTSPTTLPTFNPDDKYHFKKLQPGQGGLNITPVVFPSSAPRGVAASDLPF